MLTSLLVAILVVAEPPKAPTAPPKPPAPAEPSATIPASTFVKEKPKDAKGVHAVKVAAKAGDKVTIAGRVAGRKEPFVKGRAVFVIADGSLKACSEREGDKCPTPWDLCCESAETLKANLATIQIVGSDKKPIKAGAEGAGGLKSLSKVTIVGVVSEASKDGALVINAESIYVEQPSFSYAPAMAARLFLGIDLGTSGTKAVLIDERGAVRGAATREHPVSTPRPGWSEQDPEDWWRSAIAAVSAALAAASARAGDVAAIGLSGQMHGLVMIDARGAVLRPCILWNDQRSAPQCERVERELGIERLVALTGNRMLPGFTAPKILWCRGHERELERRAATHLLPKDWLRFRLSGTRATEVSDASGTALFDCGRRRWSSDMLAALAIDPATMPECTESPVASARVANDAAAALGLAGGTPIVGGAGDQAASAIGAGIVREGSVSVTIGTSGVVFAACDEWRPAPRGELHAFCHAVPQRWHLMGVMLSAGGSLRWFRDALTAPRGDDSYERLAAEAAAIAPGADGLTFLPYLSGERCPHPDPTARGAFVGISAVHGKAHLARAVFEGITFGLRDNLELARQLGVPVDRVLLAGGGARSTFWRQLCADVFNVPVHVARGDEGSALGAALLAGVGAGAWASVEAAVQAATDPAPMIVAPRDPSRYEVAYERFRALYRDLRPAFGRIAQSVHTELSAD